MCWRGAVKGAGGGVAPVLSTGRPLFNESQRAKKFRCALSRAIGVIKAALPDKKARPDAPLRGMSGRRRRRSQQWRPQSLGSILMNKLFFRRPEETAGNLKSRTLPQRARPQRRASSLFQVRVNNKKDQVPMRQKRADVRPVRLLIGNLLERKKSSKPRLNKTARLFALECPTCVGSRTRETHAGRAQLFSSRRVFHGALV